MRDDDRDDRDGERDDEVEAAPVGAWIMAAAATMFGATVVVDARTRRWARTFINSYGNTHQHISFNECTCIGGIWRGIGNGHGRTNCGMPNGWALARDR